jgi:hypothetical protein
VTGTGPSGRPSPDWREAFGRARQPLPDCDLGHIGVGRRIERVLHEVGLLCEPGYRLVVHVYPRITGHTGDRYPYSWRETRGYAVVDLSNPARDVVRPLSLFHAHRSPTEDHVRRRPWRPPDVSATSREPAKARGGNYPGAFHQGDTEMTKKVAKLYEVEIHAVALYDTSWYRRISSYGPYVGSPSSLCFENYLSPE